MRNAILAAIAAAAFTFPLAVHAGNMIVNARYQHRVQEQIEHLQARNYETLCHPQCAD